MNEVLLLMVMLFAAYFFIPANWFTEGTVCEKAETAGVNAGETVLVVPEDSVLRRHFITQLRSQIEREMYPRPIDPTLRRLYDTMVDEELEIRLAGLTA